MIPADDLTAQLETLCTFEANFKLFQTCQVQQNKNTIFIDQNNRRRHFYC